MLNFTDWCAETNRELPELEGLAENRARTGAKAPLYPPAYFDAQYPDLWKTPTAADAAYYQSKRGKKN